MLHFLSRKPADLIIIATHQYQERMRWLNKPIAEPIARESGEVTLFLPHGFDGFVSLDDGGISLSEILIPVDNVPDSGRAIDTAVSLAASLNLEEVRFTAVHVGSESDMSDLHTVEREGWHWDIQCTQGDPLENILQASKACRADLIVMSTTGHDGFLDALRGSTTERVVRGANCPVLAIPVNQPSQ
ncbi:MAG: universal stress protein [Gammaproteobacteria bacterium]|nr:universal stress protein [Gammaproteobacteria bacterium]